MYDYIPFRYIRFLCWLLRQILPDSPPVCIRPYGLHPHFCGGDSAMDRARNVTYIRLLYALVDSVPLCPGMYAASLTNIRKYFSFSDIPKGLGEFPSL